MRSMRNTETAQTNRYAGRCGRCGSKVAAGAGLYDRSQGVQHTTEVDCNHTTKTWKTFDNHRNFTQAQRDIDAAWKTAGFNGTPEFVPATGFCHSASENRGHFGETHVRVVVSGGRYDDPTVTGNTVRVFAHGAEIGRFTLDRDAIEAVGAEVIGPNVHRQTVGCYVEQIRQTVEGVQAALDHQPEGTSR